MRGGDSSLRGLPNLIEDFGGQCSLVLWQEATVVLLHDIGRALNGIARLLVEPGLLQNMVARMSRGLCGPCSSKPLLHLALRRDCSARGQRVSIV